jgi:hypothetical protein
MDNINNLAVVVNKRVLVTLPLEQLMVVVKMVVPVSMKGKISMDGTMLLD